MKKLLVLTAALALTSTAYASIINGPHDLSGQGTLQNGEVCVYCHTPHNALSNAATDVPLWNIVAGADTSGTSGESAMCMACHDGNVLFADQSNPANAEVAGGAGTQYVFASYGNLLADATLANDHPVGFNYAARSATKPGEFKAPAVAKISAGGNVECFSCHDVHNEVNVPFLIGTNAGSALCIDCHIK